VRIVMRPMHGRNSPWIMNHFSPHLDPIAGPYGHGGRDRDVVNDLDASGPRVRAERFVLGACAGTIEIVWPRCNRSAEIHDRGPRARVGSEEIQCRASSVRRRSRARHARQVMVVG
jgi:hypothetical protein